jgi:hypothetical protein
LTHQIHLQEMPLMPQPEWRRPAKGIQSVRKECKLNLKRPRLGLSTSSNAIPGLQRRVAFAFAFDLFRSGSYMSPRAQTVRSRCVPLVSMRRSIAWLVPCRPSPHGGFRSESLAHPQQNLAQHDSLIVLFIRSTIDER